MSPNLELMAPHAGGPPQTCLPDGSQRPQEPALLAAGGPEGGAIAPEEALNLRRGLSPACGRPVAPENGAPITDNCSREAQAEGRVNVLSGELALALWNKAWDGGGPFPERVRRFARWAIAAADNLRSRAKEDANRHQAAPATGGQS